MATVVLPADVAVPIAMLALGRIAGMKFAMLPIEVAMIVAMSASPTAAFPATVFRSMFPRLVAMEFAMLTPARIGRVQVPVLSPRIAVKGPVAAAGLAVVVALRRNVDVDVRMFRPSLDLLGPFDLLGPLGTSGFHPCSTLFGAIAFAIV